MVGGQEKGRQAGRQGRGEGTISSDPLCIMRARQSGWAAGRTLVKLPEHQLCCQIGGHRRRADARSHPAAAGAGIGSLSSQEA
jgi:hypothetical protein